MEPRHLPLAQTTTIEVSDMCYIYHITFVPPDSLLVCDGRKLKKMDAAGHVIRTLCEGYSFSSIGGDYSVSKEGGLVFIAWFHEPQGTCTYGIHKMTPNGTITTILIPAFEPMCIHSSHINGHILIGLTDNSGTGRVMRCDGTGRKIMDIEFDEEGQRLYEWPKYITENKINGDIVVSDEEKCALVVVDKKGRHRFNYTGQSTGRSFEPHGVCIDREGHILVTHKDWHTKDRFVVVSLLDKDGRFLSQLLKEQYDLYASLSLCVDDKKNVYVAFRNKIKVFR